MWWDRKTIGEYEQTKWKKIGEKKLLNWNVIGCRWKLLKCGLAEHNNTTIRLLERCQVEIGRSDGLADKHIAIKD